MLLLRRRRLRHHLAASILLLLLFFSASIWASRAQESGPFKTSLVGPGSVPPSCRSKCGTCSPCKAVHVPIQPGFSFPLEYYPEAWRCKCRNKLSMP